MEVYRAGAQDAPFVANLWLANWQSTYRGLLPDEYLDSLSYAGALETWSEYMRSEDNRVFIARAGGARLGFAACEPDSELAGCLYLHSLHVVPEARGKGVGTRLISQVWEMARTLGCSGLSICVVRGNESARRLYSELGAEHYKYFTDDSDGVVCASEKLIWRSAPGA